MLQAPFSQSELPGLGVAVGAASATAAEVESTTFLAWASSGFGSTTMGAATYSDGETAVIVAGTHALAFALVAASYEGGVVIGSLVSEIPVIGGGTVGENWGGVLFGAYQGLNRASPIGTRGAAVPGTCRPETAPRTGPPGGDELAGEFAGGLGALNRH